ncbi:MAG: Na+/H+ antiporter NhaA, partial [Desulfuromonadales bacterium]|nr:Na+/H+ antiporter NhaA [Desulfuromonadales bacterium]
MTDFMKEFLKKDSSVGIILMIATVLAMIFANSPLHFIYDFILDTPLEVRLGRHIHIGKPLLLWINDGLMAVFFFYIGLEVKREVLVGQLSSRAQIVLPGIAALGGMLVPALVYVLINAGNSAALNGWAIPAATDIAFALGILALLGDRVPASLKIFLLALAIMDDLGAIVIIAIFYSGDLSMTMLVLSTICLAILIVFNRLKLENIAPYIWVGVFLWIFVLKSGVHATLAGVALAFLIPL